MSTIELVMRVAGITQLTLLVVLLNTAHLRTAAHRALAILLVGIACYVSAPLTIEQGLRSFTSYPFVLLATLIPVMFWYFSCVVFRDGFQLRVWMTALAVLFAAIALLAFCDYANAAQCSKNGEQIVYWLSAAGKFLWTLAAFAVIAQDWSVDLVEPRRRLRRILVFGLGCYILIVLCVELAIEAAVSAQAMAMLELVNSGFILLGISAFTLHLLTLRKDDLFSLIAPSLVHERADVSVLARRLVESMQQDRRYAQDGITIAGLAQTLDVPVPELRRVINSELGYRNFNAFINHYRVTEVAQRLEQDEFKQTPLLTLALEAGFRSLAPFNRCFKDTFKATPSEYRNSLNR